MSEQSKTYSIALRVRRVTHEDAYVAVPVTDAIMRQNENGTFGIDPEAFIAEALRISGDTRVEWKTEVSEIEPHPMQEPRPDDRTCFDAFYANSARE